MILDTIAVRKALDNALAIAESRHGRLIDKPDLKSAMDYWHNQAARIGLTGAYSPHSLRYAWAQDAISHYLAQGSTGKKRWQLWRWIWGMETGVGGMWRRCMGKFDSWLRASSGWSWLPQFTVSERLGGGGKYQAALPSPYSPNLNPIERMWKLMNEHARNNRYFSSTREFRDAISVFFNQTLPDIADSLASRIKDHFQVLTPAS